MYIHDVVKQHHKLCFFKYYFRSTCYRQWQKGTEENAKQRCTIERYKEQIADMSKQLG
jgi:hypothetical protein